MIALLIYPGVGLCAALTLLVGVLIGERATFRGLRPARGWRSFDGIAALSSMLLAALALALAPWPLHPAAGSAPVGNPWLLLLAIEGAFLIPALAGLLAPSAQAARAAMREAQIGVAGRVVLWLAIGAGLWQAAEWSGSAPVGRALIAIALVLALPAAIGHGPFGAERSLNAAGAEDGLDGATADLLRLARLVRGVALMAIAIIAMLPPVAPIVALPLFTGLLILAGYGLRRAAALPRLTLPAAVRWCWWPALPLAIAGALWLALS
jgi:hypothetical protein